MTRKDAKELLPIIQAFAEGKTIQFRTNNRSWVDLLDNDIEINALFEYRIKPEPKYRPFRTKEECWNEMHKHPDFGWVRSKQWGSYALLGNISEVIIRSTDECHKDSMNYIYEAYTFTDGTPFGIKEEQSTKSRM